MSMPAGWKPAIPGRRRFREVRAHNLSFVRSQVPMFLMTSGSLVFATLSIRLRHLALNCDALMLFMTTIHDHGHDRGIEIPAEPKPRIRFRPEAIHAHIEATARICCGSWRDPLVDREWMWRG